MSQDGDEGGLLAFDSDANMIDLAKAIGEEERRVDEIARKLMGKGKYRS